MGCHADKLSYHTFTVLLSVTAIASALALSADKRGTMLSPVAHCCKQYGSGCNTAT